MRECAFRKKYEIFTAQIILVEHQCNNGAMKRLFCLTPLNAVSTTSGEMHFVQHRLSH